MSGVRWHYWRVNPCEVHVVPESERTQHMPCGCPCGADLDAMSDGVVRVTHREFGGAA
jgi:hypothetical protein